MFWCIAFVHISKYDKHKLDAKLRQCVFLGYGQDKFGYWLYDLVEKNIVKSRNVVFVEDQTIQDIEKAKKSIP